MSKCIKPQETCDRPLKYRWSLTKKNGPVGPWETVPKFSDMLSTEIENPDAVIEKDKLEPGEKYQLTVTASGPKISDGISSYIFETNKKPRDGSCEVSPTTGIALKTDFKMTCKVWLNLVECLVQILYFSITSQHICIGNTGRLSEKIEIFPESRTSMYHNLILISCINGCLVHFI